MDTKRHELLTILGQAMAEAVDLHERQEAAGLDPLQSGADPAAVGARRRHDRGVGAAPGRVAGQHLMTRWREARRRHRKEEPAS